MTPQRNAAATEIPWDLFHAVLHEARSPLTVAAYASEILLHTPGPLSSRKLRANIEAIDAASREASVCIGLLARTIEVEQAGHGPLPEPFSLDAFRDPHALSPGPAIDAGATAWIDPRIGSGFASTLWELASLFPSPRPTLDALRVEDGSIVLRLRTRGSGGFARAILEAADRMRAPGRARAVAQPPFHVHFRASLLRRCLELLGGTTQTPRPARQANEIIVQIPCHARGATSQRTSPTSHPCK